MNPTEWSITTVLIFLLLPFYCCIASYAITPNQPIRDGDVLVSTQKKFALGFFSPGNSSKRYVGVWYNNVPNRTVVWVANRDDPVNDTYGLLAVQGNGGLVIYGKDRSTPIWSASVTLSSPNNSIAKLFDTGNLVLLENESEKVLWQGFDYPSNTLLPYMKLGLNRRSGLNWLLTTWKSQDDPGTGNCSFGISPSGLPQMILYRDGAPRWRTPIGTWAGKRWGGAVSFINNEDEVSIMYVPANDSALSRTMLAESGVMERSSWNDRVHEWNKYWSAPIERCDEYGQCGPNGNCNPYNVNDIDCTCLPGFEPKSPTDWYLRDGTGGCLRKNGVLSMCGNGEGFVKVERVKIPDSSKASVDMNLDLKACEQECLRNCSCKAYSSSDEGSGCVTWQGDLMDIRTLPDVGQNLYVRVDAIVLAQYAKKSNYSLSNKGKVAISLVSVLLLFLVFSLVVWWIRRKRKGKRRQNAHLFGQSTGSPYLGHYSRKTDDENIMNSDLPFFDLTTIAAATNNFSVENKLGTGGFGSVYKGVLSNGNEIAVKRLSKNSGQGTEEFKNEVLLIAKLQHRNLVRILGYCVQDEEKMLIYEYLPNKSLDFFIFNESHRADLDWSRRFEIICGITRGILYLHQDSRLRIIHRDLKASNVLLDASMNPKIADFGMARIFRGDQSEANTNRVVGTYGYMSPEYAMRGRFSVKSDVYSFGVLLLEIITGRKNRVNYHEEAPDSNLVEHVWNLWREGNALEVVDSSLGASYPINEVLRCIQIALLCVQESATDRPTMSVVLAMLGNDATLPSPRQPAFLLQRSGDSSTADGPNSVNDVTCTAVGARVTTGPTYFQNTSADLDDGSRINSELPFFDVSTIAAATNNFSFCNKVGAGGFGSVYKGVLSNGNEVAVKRLSKNSGQGIEEFKNEVELIAKLQHRNLVRIIGCCVKDEEKMLIYEYLPNKSLDFFIFNEKNRSLLDWTRRLEIICGIARGLLYLHQDSRLRIIHRDLKASNVLLDASMNPKISDFGMARIFKGDQNEARTNRVVGTYGYMSPEYAMEGLFSVKSDVYSFGILVLEIITGKKNTGYYHEEYPDSNLVGHVWNLWREGTALEIVDPSLGELYLVNEVVRCFQLALLCVQDYATDRPTMSAVLVMLSNDAALATPREPAFVFKRTYTGGDPSTSTTEGAKSYNDVTCTLVEAR